MKLYIWPLRAASRLPRFYLPRRRCRKSARVDADGMPTNDSTPAEKAETARINSQEGATNTGPRCGHRAVARQQRAVPGAAAAVSARLQQNQAAQQDYQDRSRAYVALRARYAAERAAYHRGIWPDRYVSG